MKETSGSSELKSTMRRHCWDALKEVGAGRFRVFEVESLILSVPNQRQLTW